MLKGIFLDSVLVSFAGALLSLDRTAAFQTMVSRPIAAAPIIGYLLGNVQAGLAVGVALELLFIGDLPVGSYIPVHETGLAALVTGVTVTAADGMAGAFLGSALEASPFGPAMAAFPAALLASIPAGKLYQKADSAARGFNLRLFSGASDALEAGQERLMRENLKGLLVFFVTNFLVLLATAMPLMYGAYFISSRVSAARIFYPAFAGAVVLGTAAALKAVEAGRSFVVYCAFAAIGAVMLLLLF